MTDDEQLSTQSSGESASQRLGRMVRRAALPSLLLLLLIGLGLLWAIDLLWRSQITASLQAQREQQRMQYVALQAETLNQRFDQIGASLTNLADQLQSWRDAPPSSTIPLRSLGYAWVPRQQPDPEQEALLVFSREGIAQRLLALTGGDRFPVHARALLNSDPSLEAVGLIHDAGVVRRFPGGELLSQLRDEESLASLPPRRRAASVEAGELAWYRGGGTGGGQGADLLELAAPVYVEGRFRGAVFAQIHGRALLPDPGSGWSALVDASGRVLVADSLGHALLGIGSSPLTAHVDPSIRRLGGRLGGRQQGLQPLRTQERDDELRFIRLESTGWQLLIGQPRGGQASALDRLLAVTRVAVVVASALLLLLGLLVLRRVARAGFRTGARLDEAAEELAGAVEAIGRNNPTAVGSEHRILGLGAVAEAVSQRARDLSEQIANTKRELERASHLLDRLPFAIAVYDRRFLVQNMNNEARRLYGGSFVGGRAAWLIERGPWQGAEQARAVLEHGQARRSDREVEVEGETGRYRTFWLPLGAGGSSERVLEITEELPTGLGRSDEELQPQGAFLLALARELRSSAGIVANDSRLIARLCAHGEPSRAETAERLEKLSRESDLLARKLEDLHDLGRLADGEVEAHPRPVPLDELLERAADTAQPQLLDAESVDLVVERVRGNILLHTDSELVLTVLRVLISNSIAALAGGEGGSIILSAERSEATVALIVRDDGPGINPKLREELAHALSAQQWVARPDEGIGLGLTLAGRIATLLEGQLQLEPVASGGTRAALVLPRRDSGEEA